MPRRTGSGATAGCSTATRSPPTPRVVADADPDGATPDDPAHADATVTAGPDGVYVHVVDGTGLQAAEMKAVFEHACEVEFDRDVDERRARSVRPRPTIPCRNRRASADSPPYAIHMGPS